MDKGDLGGTPQETTNECAKVVEPETGSFTTSACATKVAKSEWIRVKKAKTKFTDKSGTSELRSAAHETITCTKDTSSGEITGIKTVGNVKVTFTGCTQGTAKVKCKSIKNPSKPTEGTEGAEEEIITNTVEGELGEVSAGTKVGEDLKPIAADTRFVTIKCGTLNIAVTGSVIGEVTPINKLQTTGTLVFAANAGNTNQEFTAFTGGAEDHLTAFSENAWLVSSDEITFEEAIEVT